MQRIKTLTSGSLQTYKFGLYILFFVIMPTILIVALSTIGLGKAIERFNQPIFYAFGIPMILAYVYSFYSFFKDLNRVRYVEYDDANLYVSHNDYQIQIPFEEIKEVNIVTGGFLFLLYKKTQVGMEVLGLPSIWYPLTYKKVDAEMNRVRQMIAKRKREFYKNENLSNSKQLSGLNI